MKPLLKCELNYFPSVHLKQIYTGFLILKKLGIIELIIKPSSENNTKPILKVIINNKFEVIYDALDGLNWIDAPIEDNLSYFNKNIKADFYFKRSYNKQVFDNAPQNCKVYPLGLNYPIEPQDKLSSSVKEMTIDLLKKNYLTSKFYKKFSFYKTDFEYYPIPNKLNKILFVTQLYNPEQTSLDHLKAERSLMNQNRINCIKSCQKIFGKQFSGGLVANDYTLKHAKDLIIPSVFSKKEIFLNSIKNHDICIATTGLHDSIGWKFGEYVAASRAIVTEPLLYELPGEFVINKNYLNYNNENQLIKNINTLLENKDKLFEMMNNNFKYYNNYLSPEKLVLNTLIKVYQNI